MNRCIISNWNDIINDDDIVYVVGDFIISRNKRFIIDTMLSLKGKIYLILGNHDRILKGYSGRNINNKIFIYNDIFKVKYKKYKFYLFHQPLLEQPDYYNKNSFHLYGHLHGKYKHPSLRAMDIGFNVQNYNLISIDNVLKYFNLIN